MKYSVTFTTIASRDIVAIWDYHESESSKSEADKVIDKILKLADSLESLPNT